MSYLAPLRATVRNGARNLVGLGVASVAVSFAFLPLLAALSVGADLVVLAGLWATCLLAGVAAVGAFRFAATVADRGVAVEALPRIGRSVREPWTGLGLGAVTFAVLVAALALVAFVPGDAGAVGTGAGLFLVLFWYVLVAFSGPALGAGTRLGRALAAGAGRFLEAPGRAVWFVLLSALFAVVAGLTVVTVVLLLPGALALLAVHVATAGEAETETGNGNET